MHVPSAAHATPARLALTAPGGFGLGWISQVAGAAVSDGTAVGSGRAAATDEAAGAEPAAARAGACAAGATAGANAIRHSVSAIADRRTARGKSGAMTRLPSPRSIEDRGPVGRGATLAPLLPRHKRMRAQLG